MTYSTQRLARPYLAAAAAALLLGALFGTLSGVTHGWPASLGVLPLTKLRPLHTTFSVAWIFLGYLGALYHFVPVVVKRDWPSVRLAHAQLALFVAAGLVSLIALAMGLSTGREYLELPLLSSGLIFAGWMLFLVNFFGLVRQLPRPWPAYVWMWATGVALFPFTFLEAHAYLMDYYGAHPVRDQAVQWKSYGTLIGTWNQVVYGLALYLTERLSGDSKVGRSAEAYLLYWLGLANLMFGFAHHTYALPQAMWIRELAYATSMSEWVILIHMFWSRVRARPESIAQGAPDEVPRRFLATANLWMAINLTLALLISIPALNAVSHGSHVTAAHAMGSTIGINSMILWAVGLAAIADGGGAVHAPSLRPVLRALHGSLLVFFVCLVGAGVSKGLKMSAGGLSFHDAMGGITHLFLIGMALSGVVLFLAMTRMCVLWLRALRPGRDVAPVSWPAPPERLTA